LVHVNGVHEAILVVELVAFNFVKYNVAIESQPAALVKLAVYAPVAEIFCVFQTMAVQLDCVVAEFVAFNFVKYNVAIESHPAALVKLAVYVPVADIFCVFQIIAEQLD
jgi:hypothetical protein